MKSQVEFLGTRVKVLEYVLVFFILLTTVFGVFSFLAAKNAGPLGLDLFSWSPGIEYDLTADLQPLFIFDNVHLEGQITLSPGIINGEPAVKLKGYIRGLKPGSHHQLLILEDSEIAQAPKTHTTPDIGVTTKTYNHFNPYRGTKHSCKQPGEGEVGHVGDLGVFITDEGGEVDIDYHIVNFPLDLVRGRAIVIGDSDSVSQCNAAVTGIDGRHILAVGLLGVISKRGSVYKASANMTGGGTAQETIKATKNSSEMAAIIPIQHDGGAMNTERNVSQREGSGGVEKNSHQVLGNASKGRKDGRKKGNRIFRGQRSKGEVGFLEQPRNEGGIGIFDTHHRQRSVRGNHARQQTLQRNPDGFLEEVHALHTLPVHAKNTVGSISTTVDGTKATMKEDHETTDENDEVHLQAPVTLVDLQTGKYGRLSEMGEKSELKGGDAMSKVKAMISNGPEEKRMIYSKLQELINELPIPAA